MTLSAFDKLRSSLLITNGGPVKCPFVSSCRHGTRTVCLKQTVERFVRVFTVYLRKPLSLGVA